MFVRDSDEEVCRAMLEGLEVMPESYRRDSTWEFVSEMGPSAGCFLPILVKELNRAHRYGRYNIYNAISWLRNRSAYDILMKGVASRDWNVQLYAAMGPGRSSRCASSA